MLKKKSFYIVMLIIGACLLGAGVWLGIYPEVPKSVGGVCLGVGAGLAGMGISSLVMKRMETKNPGLKKLNQIEFEDERNTMIRNRAKAKAGDIIQWFIIGVAYITILTGAELWLTLAVTGVFALKYILQLYFMGKYQKEQ